MLWEFNYPYPCQRGEFEELLIILAKGKWDLTQRLMG
jgi:hypothetical protein